jgi:hypothetical protein
MLPIIKDDGQLHLFILWGDGSSAPLARESLQPFKEPGEIITSPQTLCKYAHDQDMAVDDSTLGRIAKYWYNHHNPQQQLDLKEGQ